jgi:hypothetical protein
MGVAKWARREPKCSKNRGKNELSSTSGGQNGGHQEEATNHPELTELVNLFQQLGSSDQARLISFAKSLVLTSSSITMAAADTRGDQPISA